MGSSRSYGNRKRPSTIVTIPGRRVLPPILNTTFNYVDKVTIAIVVGGAGAYVYSGNGLYDPNITSSGAQPQMFDELMTYYRYYNVVASKIKISSICSSTTEGFDIYVAPTNNTTSTYNFVSATTIPGVKWKTVGPSNSLSLGKIINYRKTSIQAGVAYNDDTLLGNTGTNPTNQWYWRIGCSPINSASTSTYNVFLTVELTYYTRLSSVNVVAQG